MSRMIGTAHRRTVLKNNGEFRVINTNELAQQKIMQALENERRLMQAATGEDTSDEDAAFSALFEDLDLAPEVADSTDRVLGNNAPAKPEDSSKPEHDYEAEGNAILEAARLEAERIISEANGQAQRLREDAVSQGRDIGISQAKAEMQQELDTRKQELEQQYMIKQATLERDLVDTILTVVDKVFKTQLAGKKSIVLQMVSDCIAGIDGAKHFNIRVSHKNIQLMNGMIANLQEQMGSAITIEATPDAGFNDTQVVIETETGIFDCSPLKEFENLCNDIRSLAAEK